MDAIESLTKFISKTISKTKAARYRTIIKSPKGQIIFIKALDHDFEEFITPDKIIKSLDYKAWESPAYSFDEESGFGKSWRTFKEAYENIYPESILIITQDGKIGLFIPEFPTDDIFLAI